MRNLNVNIDTRRLRPFIQLLGRGFVFKTRAGWSVKACLCDGLGIDSDYLEHRIQTVFLDGKPVDDVSVETVADGSRLALSAAMPGLVGATFRKGGYLSAMRIKSASPQKHGWKSGRTAAVTIKLFNLVARELGPTLLKRGLEVSGRDLGDLLARQDQTFGEACRAVRMGGREIDRRQLKDAVSSQDTIHLQVTGIS